MIIQIMEIIAFISMATLFYIYMGYPLLLYFLTKTVKKKAPQKSELLPHVTLIISCFNEEKVIREKLENSLEIDYPGEKLEILVVSDASSDGSDDIVKEFEDKGVTLVRQEERKGKTSGLNSAVPQAEGEIIVFSDANAMYEPDSIRKLVGNFSDPGVGYVVGEARYQAFEETRAGKSENTYWNYEIFLKKMESSLHSVVGGDGAIYAIRKELYERLEETDINDFVNPLQIILKGFRGIYEPEAICWEYPAGSFESEFRRKVRIVNRSFSGFLRVKGVMSPFKTGLFSLEVVSHKLLRWFTPFFLLLFFFSSLTLSFYNLPLFQWCTFLLLSFFFLAYIGYWFSSREKSSPLIYFPYYFMLVNLASILGIYRSLTRRVQVVWDPFRTEKGGNSDGSAKSLIHLCAALFFFFYFIEIEMLSGLPLLSAKILFILSLFLMFYVYFGYPLLLSVISGISPRKIDQKEIYPYVSILVCAYNEEAVIEKKIQNSFAIDYPEDKLKIYIASDGSSDRTNEIVKKYENEKIKLIAYEERNGKIGVINKTVPTLSSEIIVFSDANTMFASDSVKKLVRNFNDPSVGAVSADVILKGDGSSFSASESLYYKYERWVQSRETMVDSIIGADGGLYAIRRELFKSPSANIILDDFVISMNVTIQGKRVVYDSEVIGYEDSPDSHKTEFLRKSRVVAGAVQVLKQKEGVPSLNNGKLFFCFVSHKLLRWFIPVFLIIAYVANLRILLQEGGHVYSVLFLSQNVFYGLALSGLIVEPLTRFSAVRIPFYFCLVNSSALYGIYKGVLNKQSVKWRKFERTESVVES